MLDNVVDGIGDDNTADTVAQRAFTVHGKRNIDKKYTFKTFTSARQGKELFQKTTMSLAKKKDLYEEIKMLHEDAQRRVERMTRQGRKALEIPTFSVPIEALEVDDAWARDKLVDWNHVADIAMDFHEKSVAVPSCSIRCIYDQRQELIDIIFGVPDGVHRTTAAMELGYTDITMSVQFVDSVREEAEISNDCNYRRRAHSGGDILKNRLTAEEDRILALKTLVEAHEFKLSMRVGGSKSGTEIGAVPTLEKLLRKYGVEVFTRILELFSNPQFTHWHGSPATLTADMFAGLALYIHEFERPGFIHSNMTTHMFCNTTPMLITQLAGEITKPIASVVFNREVCPNAKDLGSEDGRAYRYCTAMVRQVEELFKERNKPRTDYLSRFKTSYELFDSTSETRMADLMGNRRFCANKGMPDYWWAKKHSNLTR
ncbi:hypothetical protein [Sphingorhabdus sp.]|uniref:hypothetical protein n=1 Tax=Sphingorhabdus sp. TaxID=1902408 RepID=UPI00333E9ECD